MEIESNLNVKTNEKNIKSEKKNTIKDIHLLIRLGEIEKLKENNKEI